MSRGTKVFEALQRLQAAHGTKLDLSKIPAGLKRCAVTTDCRVKLNTGEFGSIGITTGWQPVLILLPNVRSTGSSRVLGPDDYVTHIRVSGRYVPWFTFPDEQAAAADSQTS